MFNLFGNERKSKRLKKDALTIIRSDEVAYRSAHLKACAAMVAEYLGTFFPATPKIRTGPRSAISLKQRHRDARRRRDQVQLTAATLSIIYLRAREIGPLGAPTCEIIDNAMERWTGDPDAAPDAPPDPTRASASLTPK